MTVIDHLPSQNVRYGRLKKQMYRLLKTGTVVSQIVIIKKAYGLLQILALARQKDRMTATQRAIANSGLLKAH